MNKTTYIHTMPSETQAKIEALLINAGLSDEDIELAMDSRLCDLEDTIDISEVITE